MGERMEELEGEKRGKAYLVVTGKKILGKNWQKEGGGGQRGILIKEMANESKEKGARGGREKRGEGGGGLGPETFFKRGTRLKNKLHLL